MDTLDILLLILIFLNLVSLVFAVNRLYEASKREGHDVKYTGTRAEYSKRRIEHLKKQE